MYEEKFYKLLDTPSNGEDNSLSISSSSNASHSWFSPLHGELSSDDFPFNMTVEQTSFLMISLATFGSALLIGLGWLTVKLSRKKMRHHNKVTSRENSYRNHKEAEDRILLLELGYFNMTPLGECKRSFTKDSISLYTSLPCICEGVKCHTKPFEGKSETKKDEMFKEKLLFDEDELTNISNAFERGLILQKGVHCNTWPKVSSKHSTDMQKVETFHE